MASEIERRFLLAVTPPLEQWGAPYPIMQAYLSLNPEKIVRVRVKGDAAYLTVKGLRVNGVAPEYEYPIPVSDAFEMAALAPDDTLSKRRYDVAGPDGKTWEVDMFEGPLAGLQIAEIELPALDAPLRFPSWLRGYEITNDNRFANAALTALDGKGLAALLAEYKARPHDVFSI